MYKNGEKGSYLRKKVQKGGRDFSCRLSVLYKRELPFQLFPCTLVYSYSFSAPILRRFPTLMFCDTLLTLIHKRRAYGKAHRTDETVTRYHRTVKVGKRALEWVRRDWHTSVCKEIVKRKLSLHKSTEGGRDFSCRAFVLYAKINFLSTISFTLLCYSFSAPILRRFPTLTVLWYLADIDTQAQERMERL